MHFATSKKETTGIGDVTEAQTDADDHDHGRTMFKSVQDKVAICQDETRQVEKGDT